MLFKSLLFHKLMPTKGLVGLEELGLASAIVFIVHIFSEKIYFKIIFLRFKGPIFAM